MEWVILFLIGLGLWFLITLRAGRLNFWRLIAQHPDEAYEYFKSHSGAWMVIDTKEKDFIHKFYRNNPQYRDEWVGPYRLAVPSINKIIQIFGKRDLYEEEQIRLINLLKEKEIDVLK